MALCLGLLVCLVAAASTAPSSVPVVPVASDDELPYDLGEPEVMAALGFESWGPIDIGPKGWGGSEGVEAKLVASGWHFLETEHFRWASSLGRENLSNKEQARLAPYFERLRAAGVDLPKKVKKLDSTLRLVVMAMRAEDLYTRFLVLIDKTDADFPESRMAQGDGPYMGNGRYLGEAEKFEVIVHASSVTHGVWTFEHMGTAVTGSLRWHFRDPHKMSASVPASDPDLKKDRWLWPHIAHDLGHMFLAAYKHNSYDPPVWLDEGLALYLEREAEPESITTEGEEGSLNEHIGHSDWKPELAKLVKKQEPRTAELMGRRTPGSLSEMDLVACWSRVQFLATEHPAKFAELLGILKGQLDAEGYPSGNDLDGLQRRAFKELWDWTPADLDAAHLAWLRGDEPEE